MVGYLLICTTCLRPSKFAEPIITRMAVTDRAFEKLDEAIRHWPLSDLAAVGSTFVEYRPSHLTDDEISRVLTIFQTEIELRSAVATVVIEDSSEPFWLTVAVMACECDCCHGEIRAAHEFVFRWDPKIALCRSCADRLGVSHTPSRKWREAQARDNVNRPPETHAETRRLAAERYEAWSDALWRVLPTDGPGATYNDLEDALGCARIEWGAALRSLVRRDYVECLGRGVRGDPKRFRRVQSS
jgi:hypothetical protein